MLLIVAMKTLRVNSYIALGAILVIAIASALMVPTH